MISNRSIVSMILSLVILSAVAGISPAVAQDSSDSKPKVGIKKKKIKKRSKAKKSKSKKKAQSKKIEKAPEKSAPDEE